MAIQYGGTATWTTGGTTITISGQDINSWTADMMISLGSSSKITSSTEQYRITAVTPSGTTGGTVTVATALMTYPGSAQSYILNTQAFNGSGIALLNSTSSTIQNAIASMLGAGAVADGNSRVLELNKASSGALGRLIWKTGGTAQFMLDQAAVSSVEYLTLKRTTDGSSYTDVFSANKTTGEITFTGSLKMSGGASGDRHSYRNRIINGDFRINQRVVSGTVTLSAGVYGHDRWRGGASGGTYTFATQSDGSVLPTISANTLRQTVEAANIDGTSFVLSWTGTATARVWQGSASGSYAASPVVVTGLTANTDTVIEFSTGTVTKVQFEPGGVATAFEKRDVTTELALCQRYFCKSYDMATAPGTASNAGAVTLVFYGGSVNIAGGRVALPVRMRTTPTVTLYSTSTGTSGKIRDDVAAADINGTADNLGTSGFRFYGTRGAAGNVDFQVQFTASAEF